MNKFQQIFNKKGYFIQRNIFSNEFIDNLIDEISKIKNANFYYDTHKKLRRIEKLYDKGKYLKELKIKMIKSERVGMSMEISL